MPRITDDLERNCPKTRWRVNFWTSRWDLIHGGLQAKFKASSGNFQIWKITNTVWPGSNSDKFRSSSPPHYDPWWGPWAKIWQIMPWHQWICLSLFFSLLANDDGHWPTLTLWDLKDHAPPRWCFFSAPMEVLISPESWLNTNCAASWCNPNLGDQDSIKPIMELKMPIARGPRKTTHMECSDTLVIDWIFMESGIFARFECWCKDFAVFPSIFDFPLLLSFQYFYPGNKKMEKWWQLADLYLPVC